MKEIMITKASGETAAFDPGKLRLSLQRSGANEKIITESIDALESRLYESNFTFVSHLLILLLFIL
jgi:transcriptional regulator NrdR family protein